MCCRSVGLVQRVIERSGVSTVSLSMIPDLTASVGAPAIAAVEPPPSRPLGKPGDADGQRAVLSAALAVLESAREPGMVVHLPFTWPEPARQVVKEAIDPPPIAKLIREQPLLLQNLISGDFP